jgi:hypothetical protein
MCYNILYINKLEMFLYLIFIILNNIMSTLNSFKVKYHKLIKNTPLFFMSVILFCSSIFHPLVVSAVDGEITYTGTNTLLTGDDVSAGPFNIGFTFPFYGTNYTQAYVNINGTLNFGAGYSRYANVPLNTAISGTNIADNSIYAFWDDLNTNGFQNIYYATVGTAPNRQFVTQWTNIYFHGTSIQLGTFQVILYETSNIVQIQYRDLLGGNRALGDSATIGLRKNNSLSHQYSHNTASLSAEQAIRYTPDGNGSYTVNTNADYELVYLAPAGAPTSPTLVNPTDGTTGVTLTPTFEWLPVESATSYTVLISTVSNFSSTVVNQSGITGTSYSLGSALNQNTTYYWRVQSVNSNGSSLSPSRSFVTGSINNAPSAPSNVSSDVLIGGQSTSNVSGATLSATLSDPDDSEQVRYRIQIANNSNFSDLVIDYRSSFGDEGSFLYTYGESGGTYLVGNSSTVLPVGGYYLRIRAEDDAAASSAWHTVSGVAFSVVIAPDTTPPTISSISVSSIDTSSATITWSTNENSNSVVEYGTTESYGSQVDSSDLVTSHSMALSGLSPSTLYYYRVSSTDSSSNTAISNQFSFTTSNPPDISAPVISGLSVDPEENSATIYWTTDEPASSLVDYGPSSSYVSSTSIINTDPRVTNHEVVISNLESCVTYHYRVVSSDSSSNQVQGADNSFTTKGCVGGAIVTSQTASSVSNSTGGTLDLKTSGLGISLSVPPAFSGASAHFQIKKIDDVTARSSTGVPVGSTPAGSHIYELHAVTDTFEIIESFDEPITITLSYGSSDVEGVVESSLRIHRWHNSEWTPLSDCIVDTVLKIVTCSTGHFSTFGLFGEGVPVIVANNSSSFRRSGPPLSLRLNNLTAVNNMNTAQKIMAQSSESFKNQDGSIVAVVPEVMTDMNTEYVKNNCIVSPVNRILRFGSKGEDVRVLQRFLNCIGFILATDGPGSPGKETNEFSTRTYDSVVKFQEKYSADILDPLNLKKGTGVFGNFSKQKAEQFSGE